MELTRDHLVHAHRLEPEIHRGGQPIGHRLLGVGLRVTGAHGELEEVDTGGDGLGQEVSAFGDRASGDPGSRPCRSNWGSRS